MTHHAIKVCTCMQLGGTVFGVAADNVASDAAAAAGGAGCAGDEAALRAFRGDRGGEGFI